MKKYTVNRMFGMLEHQIETLTFEKLKDAKNWAKKAPAYRIRLNGYKGAEFRPIVAQQGF